MSLRAHWAIPVVLAAAVFGCGKPQPRETRELRIDGKPVELKAGVFDALMAQADQLCEVAGFLSTSVDARSMPSAGSRSREEVSSAQPGGEGMVSTQRTSMALNANLERLLQEYNQRVPGKPVDPKVHARIVERLGAERSGWQLAVWYVSDTAPEASLDKFSRYTFRKISLGPSDIECIVKAVEGGAVRR